MLDIATEEQLDEALSRPGDAVVDMMQRIAGDIIILGAAGKMGLTLARMAARAVADAGVSKKVLGVARFSDPDARAALDAHGVETLRCDLADPEAVMALPEAPNVLFMVGRKFGTAGAEPLTWGLNTLTAANAARKYAASRIVAFSTGCVYPLADVTGKGCDEHTPPDPVGEYAQACLGRERIFQYFSEINGTPILLYRLNYAIDLRYGVLHDIAQWVWTEQPVPLNVPAFNCLWQRDANERALLCLEHCDSPAVPLNVTGLETIDVRTTAEQLADRLGRNVRFAGEPGARAYLADASESVRRFGPPTTSTQQMIAATAAWTKKGGISLDKPTHFEVSNGTY